MVTLSEPVADGLYTTPGSSPTKAVKLRLTDGSSAISAVDTLPPTCADVRSTCAASAVTVMLSSKAPTRSARSTWSVAPTRRTMSSRTSLLKPVSST